ncbi:MAG: hypothetical protein AVO33_08270 [delta proteobacterium ML8_F1]|nr:MAG: hypothetical protein AVO33_08270 [delta proteobacterium ML8_F1]
MAKFDLIELKKKVNAERAARGAGQQEENLLEKILKVFVVAISLIIFYDFILTYGFSIGVNSGIAVLFIFLTALRARQVFKKK